MELCVSLCFLGLLFFVKCSWLALAPTNNLYIKNYGILRVLALPQNFVVKNIWNWDCSFDKYSWVSWGGALCFLRWKLSLVGGECKEWKGAICSTVAGANAGGGKFRFKGGDGTTCCSWLIHILEVEYHASKVQAIEKGTVGWEEVARKEHNRLLRSRHFLKKCRIPSVDALIVLIVKSKKEKILLSHY